MKRCLTLMLCLCAVATMAFTAEPPAKSVKSFSYHESAVNGIPKEWGRLVNASSFADGSAAMFFEAPDGTIRRVCVKFFSSDVQWPTRVVVIPRS